MVTSGSNKKQKQSKNKKATGKKLQNNTISDSTTATSNFYVQSVPESDNQT